jgi:hypothetical protein
MAKYAGERESWGRESASARGVLGEGVLVALCYPFAFG